ncbi:hypothetical protein BJ508DRAFT_337243 [Ascobolus immersus RN42]|uniref:Uncharacterized protein n=1 Tax=Ascobolus immersus RN42 TaxID=1160509 RepID=A0A3N4ITB2_ASCIM|nr:hypothetical protein BJ508DRAFT_337243 [Ascobolus immersus RN42]
MLAHSLAVLYTVLSLVLFGIFPVLARPVAALAVSLSGVMKQTAQARSLNTPASDTAEPLPESHVPYDVVKEGKSSSTGVYVAVGVITFVALLAFSVLLRYLWIRFAKQHQTNNLRLAGKKPSRGHRFWAKKTKGSYASLPEDTVAVHQYDLPQLSGFGNDSSRRNAVVISQDSRPRTSLKQVLNRPKVHLHDPETARADGVIGFRASQPPVAIPVAEVGKSNTHTGASPSSIASQTAVARGSDDTDTGDLSLISRRNSFEMGDDEQFFTVVKPTGSARPSTISRPENVNPNLQALQVPSVSTSHQGALGTGADGGLKPKELNEGERRGSASSSSKSHRSFLGKLMPKSKNSNGSRGQHAPSRKNGELPGGGDGPFIRCIPNSYTLTTLGTISPCPITSITSCNPNKEPQHHKLPPRGGYSEGKIITVCQADGTCEISVPTPPNTVADKHPTAERISHQTSLSEHQVLSPSRIVFDYNSPTTEASLPKAATPKSSVQAKVLPQDDKSNRNSPSRPLKLSDMLGPNFPHILSIALIGIIFDIFNIIGTECFPLPQLAIQTSLPYAQTILKVESEDREVSGDTLDLLKAWSPLIYALTGLLGVITLFITGHMTVRGYKWLQRRARRQRLVDSLALEAFRLSVLEPARLAAETATTIPTPSTAPAPTGQHEEADPSPGPTSPQAISSRPVSPIAESFQSIPISLGDLNRTSFYMETPMRKLTMMRVPNASSSTLNPVEPRSPSRIRIDNDGQIVRRASSDVGVNSSITDFRNSPSQSSPSLSHTLSHTISRGTTLRAVETAQVPVSSVELLSEAERRALEEEEERRAAAIQNYDERIAGYIKWCSDLIRIAGPGA